MSAVAPPPLAEQIRTTLAVWAEAQHDVVRLSASFADSDEWLLGGWPTAAHWLAEAADVEVCTAREWIRVGRCLRRLPLIAAAFARGELSYSKVRALTRLATPDNEQELLAIAHTSSANDLPTELARWFQRNHTPDEVDELHRRRRSVTWRHEPDGMVVFTVRLAPLVAGILIAALNAIILRRSAATAKSGEDASAGSWPSLAQQRADAFEDLVRSGDGDVITEVIVHVRGDGCTLDDGTPVTDSVAAHVAPTSFIRALIHDIDGRPIDATNRRRHPTTRQRRVVKERDRRCCDCGSAVLLEYDHDPPYELSGHTIVDELRLRCAPCHRRRHRER